MKNITTLLLFTLLICWKTQAQISLVNFAAGFTRACDITHCGDDRLFVVEQGGKIWILTKAGIKLPSPFLDIDPRVGSNGNEQGLLGLAFHPDYEQNGFFYVNYTNNNGNTKVSRFSVSASDPNIANPNSELILLEATQPFSNHNGGCLKFGPDGYLYIGLGDGGSGGDPQGFGQNKNSFLGKMLRIDVDSGSPYAVPANNPFVNDPTTLNEIWALGLRNPWRFSFDRTTGDLWIGDVGQNAWEEIDFQPASSNGGENYGWRCYEGAHPFNTSNCPNVNTLTMPVAEYANSGSLGCSVTGGFVYRGFNYPQLYGKYLYTDYCSGRVWSVVPNGLGGWTNTQIADLVNNQLVSFGENKNGELFLLGNSNGIVYRLRDAAEEWTYQIVATPSFCANANVGSIQINFSLNTPAPTVTWSDGGTGATRTGLASGNYTATITGTNGSVAAETIALVSTQTVSMSSSSTELSCPDVADGSIDLTLEGTNNPPATVIWSDGSTDLDRTGLAAGQYSVTVTSGEGCIFEETFEIIVTNSVSLVSAITDVACAGDADGGILLVLEGTGAAPASVIWSDGNTDLDRTGLAVGEYSVTLTSVEGCTVEGNFEIIALNNISLTATVSDVLCPDAADGSIDLTLEGTVNPPASILWSDGSTDLDRTGLAAGAYSVTVTSEEGCVVEGTFGVVVSSNALLTGVVTDVPCSEAANGSIDVALNGSTAASAVWDDGNTELNRTGLSAGEYSVTVTSEEGCTFEETFTIAVSGSISLLSVVNNIPCSNADDGSIALTLAGTIAPPAAVIWNDGSTDLTRTGLAAGDYSVTVTSEEGCVFPNNFEITVAAILSLMGNVTDVPCAEAANGGIDLTLEGSALPIVAVAWSDGNTDFDRMGLAAGDYTVTVTSAEGCVLEEIFTIAVSPTISLSGVVTGVPCMEAANGSIDMNLIGSDALDATFLWSDGSIDFDRTGLSAGEHRVTVTSVEGCIFEETFEVVVLNSIFLSGVASDVPCEEAESGSIDLTLSGSTAAPTAAWSDGSSDLDRTGLAAGEYSVTVTSAEGCVFEETFEVVALNAISLTGIVTDVTCPIANGGIDLILIGSNAAPSAVIWNDGNTDLNRTGLAAGGYSVTVTSEEGCVFEETFVVIAANVVSLSGVATNVLCVGGADGSIDLTLNNSSALPTSVVWSDGSTDFDRTGLAGGAYTVTVTSAEGCFFEETFEVTEPFFTIPPFIFQTTSGVLQIEDVWGDYQWLLNGVPIIDANQSTYIVYETGTYSVQVGIGCVYFSNEIFIVIEATSAIQELTSVKVRPNPFSQHIQLELMVSEPVSLQMLLRDLQGKTVFTEQLSVLSTSERLFDFGHLPSGTYLLLLQNEKGEWVEKIVKL